MQINVSDVTLASIVDRVVDYDDDGEQVGETGRTLGELVAGQIVTRIVDHARWAAYYEKVSDIRTEIIREAIRPQIEEALAQPVRKTNTYGEPTGQEITLTELVVEEARKALTAPADPSGYGSRQTFVQKAVAEEVRRALGAEIKTAVEQARAAVSDQIGEQVAAAVKAGLTARR